MGMRISQAEVVTSQATSYLRQLCRHWSHKFPTEFNDESGRIELPSGLCVLQAEPERLRVRLEMPDEADAQRFEHVVAEHLQRFGFRETLQFEWRRQSL